MRAKNNIVEQIREKIARMVQASQRGVILQPGAIGDCILTLPLAEFMKETVCRGGVDVIGHTEYIGVLPGRSCIDAVRSMDSMDLHRLFAKETEFALADGDPLILSLADYTWIVTFLGEVNSGFEQNLIFTANCSHSAEVMMLEMKPKEGASRHISDFYREQFIAQSGFDPSTTLGTGKLTASGLSAGEPKQTVSKPLIRSTQADRNKGREILDEAGVSQTLKPIVIHPGSGGAKKCWHLDNFLSVAKMLAKEGAEAVFLLGPAEAERFGESAMAKIGAASRILSNLPLTDVLAVLSCARGYIGNDSGITHLAGALGVRTVAVFGPTEAAVYGPVGPAVIVLHSRESNFAEAVSKDLQQKVAAALLC
jgi:ADP-heptose:LPS heptosyltransferase